MIDVLIHATMAGAVAGWVANGLTRCNPFWQRRIGGAPGGRWESPGAPRHCSSGVVTTQNCSNPLLKAFGQEMATIRS